MIKNLFSLMLVCSFASFGFGQATGTKPIGGGGGGGNNPDPISVSISAAPNPVVLGHRVEASVVVTGGNGSYTFSWGARCKDDAAPFPFVAKDPNDEPTKFHMNATMIGTWEIRCQVTDTAGNTGLGKTEVRVLAPNKIEIVKGQVLSNKATQPGEVFTGVHHFIFKHNTTPVGPYATGVAAEKLWNPNASEPKNWLTAQGTGQPDATFYFATPVIHDTRFFILDPEFQNKPIDNLNNHDPRIPPLWIQKQRVKVDFPKCDGTTQEVKSGLLWFRVRKIAADQVVFEVVFDKK